MLSRRIIPCLDVREGRVVKGVRFRDHVDMGDIVDLALRYRDAGADELVFYDISASPQGRSVDRGWVERVSRLIDIPFCVAGGIRDVETARAVLHAGADKISVNTPALERPALISELAEAFGVQCVVVGIDSIRETDGEWRVRSHTGDPDRTRELPIRTLDWIAEAVRLGAGEIAHFAEAFLQADVDGALAASVFHSGRIAIPALKRELADQAIDMRLQ